MKTPVVECNERTIPNKVGFGILGFIYAVSAYQIPALAVAFVITSTGVADLIRASILIQLVVGVLLSMLAYSLVSNRSLKSGMRVCYGLIIVPLFAIGGYTILVSL